MKNMAILLSVLLLCVLLGCSYEPSEPQTDTSSSMFSNVPSVSIGDEVIQACIVYADSLGYQAGKFQKAVLLGESNVNSVYCENSEYKEMVDNSDIVVIFDGIRCVFDVQSNFILGRIPYV